MDKYISKNDLLNKYNSKILIQIPKLKKITVEITSQNIVHSFFKKASFSESDLKIKSYFILYLVQSYRPFILFSRLKPSKYNLTNDNFFLKVVLSDKKDVFYFLTTLFIEYYSKLLVEDNYFFNKTNINSTQNLKFNMNNYILSTSVSLCLFSELDIFLNSNFLALNVKNIYFNINFCFDNLSFNHSVSVIKTIKNLNLFWFNK